MATDVLMPQMGESIAEGTITKWLKKVGDTVERDEPLYEISTDKVDAEIPSPESGVLTEIVVGEGETVEVKTVVARIGEEGEGGGDDSDGDEKQEESGKDESSGDEAQKKPEKDEQADEDEADDEDTDDDSDEDQDEGDKRDEKKAPKQDKSDDGDSTPKKKESGKSASREERVSVKSSPLVRKIAAEHGVDLTEVKGTGVHGRVTKEDILAHVEKGDRAPEPAESKPADSGEEKREVKAPKPSVPVGASDRVEPMSRIRSIIAKHMVESKRTSAHVHTFYEIDMHRVDQIRRKHKESFVQRTGGAKLTYTVFMAKAVIDALREFEVINASIDGDDIVYHGSVNLGMAVALDWGLIVPVIDDAQDLSMEGLAKAITDKATRARDRKLGPDEISGSTFSITNPGSLGSLIGTPIINQPNVAILGMGKVEKRVVVVDDMITIRPRMFVVLGYDHRLIDGATAEKFLSTIKHKLENFDETAL